MAIKEKEKSQMSNQTIFNGKVADENNKAKTYRVQMYSGFNQITSTKLFQVLTSKKVNLKTTPENVNGDVSFTIELQQNDNVFTLGRISFYENDLTDESSTEEQNEVISTFVSAVEEAGEMNLHKLLSEAEGEEILGDLLK